MEVVSSLLAVRLFVQSVQSFTCPRVADLALHASRSLGKNKLDAFKISIGGIPFSGMEVVPSLLAVRLFVQSV